MALAKTKARIRSRLQKHAPKLDDAIAQARWRSHNRERVADFGPLDDPKLDALLADLRANGIAIGRFEDLFGSRDLFEEANAVAQRVVAESQRVPAPDKPFLIRLRGDHAELDDPHTRLALHPNVLALANRYLGMRSLLCAVELWLTVPTEDPEMQTQLWHRDGDDIMNVKLFVYCSRVTEAAGPFTYAPGTHPLGRRRRIPEQLPGGRSRDRQMAEIVPPNEWVVATGEPGTIVLADTCGYHKQQKPTTEERLLIAAQYTSATPIFPRELEISGVDGAELTEEQRYAVFERP